MWRRTSRGVATSRISLYGFLSIFPALLAVIPVLGSQLEQNWAPLKCNVWTLIGWWRDLDDVLVIEERRGAKATRRRP